MNSVNEHIQNNCLLLKIKILIYYIYMIIYSYIIVLFNYIKDLLEW